MISKITALELLKRKAKRHLRIKKRIFGNKCGFKLWTRKRSKTAIKRSLHLNDIAMKKKHSEWAEIRRRMQKLEKKGKKVTKRIDQLSDANKKARDALTKLDHLKYHISFRIKRCDRLNTQFGTVPPTVLPTIVADPIQVPVLLDDGINNADGQEEVVADQPIPNVEPQNQIADHNVENLREDGVVEEESTSAEEENHEQETNEQGIIPDASDVLTDALPPQTLPIVAPVSPSLENEVKEQKLLPQLLDSESNTAKPPKDLESTVPTLLIGEVQDTVVGDNVLVEEQNQEPIQQESTVMTTDSVEKESFSTQAPVSIPTSSDKKIPRTGKLLLQDQRFIPVAPPERSDPIVNPSEKQAEESETVEKEPVARRVVQYDDQDRLNVITTGKLGIFFTTLFLESKSFWGSKPDLLKKIDEFVMKKKRRVIKRREVELAFGLVEIRLKDDCREIFALYCAINEFLAGSKAQQDFAIRIAILLSEKRGLMNVLNKMERTLFRQIEDCADVFLKRYLNNYLQYHQNRYDLKKPIEENAKYEWRSSLPDIEVPAEYPSFKECKLVKEGKERHIGYGNQAEKKPLYAAFYDFLTTTKIESKVLDLDFCLLETAIAANLDTRIIEFEKKIFGGIFEHFENLESKYPFFEL